ncbi:hypothetical protein [Corallococcus silvisoli]|uniref:hypothetical protein n=1 Tax=Corallococcus silvisoli TaxID=2697031 RepID=UPI0013786289|nr:hypothetical protein [Corallococcus silvisoli]NBD09637.1 hypothetical protein [Corallococcus silvisoli]
MAFKKLNTYVLAGPGTVPIKAGEFRVSKGCNATAMRLKVTAQLTNSGTARALTEPERQTFLSTVVDHTLRWGADGQHKPRSNVSFGRERILVRQMMGSELEGWADSTTGLARSIGSTATTVQWYQRIHLCGVYKDPATDSLWGIGPTQAESITVDLRRNAPTLPSGFTLTGAMTLELIPDEFTSKYDRVTPVPTWNEFVEANKVANFVPGLPLYLVERSAAHAASALTDVSLRIDGLELFSKVGVNEVITKWLDTPNYWAENQTFDAETILHLLLPGQRLADWPTGTPTLEQDTKTLATGQYGQLVVEVMTDAEVDRDVAYFAAAKGKRISAVSLPVMLGIETPDNIKFALPYALLDEQDSEFDRYPGRTCMPGESVRVYFPLAAAARAKARVELHEAAREYLAAEKVRRELAGTVPGAVQSPRGWGQRTSPVLEASRTVLRK